MARCLRWNTPTCLFQNLGRKMRQYKEPKRGYHRLGSQGMFCVIATSYEGCHTGDGPIGNRLCLEPLYSRIQMATASWTMPHIHFPRFTYLDDYDDLLQPSARSPLMITNLSYNGTFSVRYRRYSKTATCRRPGSSESPKIGSHWVSTDTMRFVDCVNDHHPRALRTSLYNNHSSIGLWTKDVMRFRETA